jgi:translation initiation factor 1A
METAAGQCPPGDEVIRARLPRKRGREIFGSAGLMIGANPIRDRCFDRVTRMGRIKGKIKKNVWIGEGDIPVVIPWNFQDENAIVCTGIPGRRWGGPGGIVFSDGFLDVSLLKFKKVIRV